MRKNEIFFGESGLSSTSANHIANLAKEAYQAIDKELENVSFVTTHIKLLDSSAPQYLLEEGGNESTLHSYFFKLQEKAELQSLIAWLREAIKAKEELTKANSRLDLETFCQMHNLEYPETPVREHALSEDEYYDSLSIKERNRYYELETLCAVIGKFIHLKGTFNEAREWLNTVVKKPRKSSGSGKETTIYIYEPSVSPEDVNEVFFDLQNKHREYQAELNGIKHKCELAVQKSIDEADAKFQKEYETYRMKVNSLNNELFSYRKDEGARIRNLKIVIPNSLKDIYNKVASLGKEEKVNNPF